MTEQLFRLVVIESPYAGDVDANLAYLDKAILDCLARGESPYASHKMLTTALDDDIPDQRALGISAGLAFRRMVQGRVFYCDRGWSSGMRAALDLYLSEGLSWELRFLTHAASFHFPRGEGESLRSWSKRIREFSPPCPSKHTH